MEIINGKVIIYRASYFNKKLGRRVYAHEYGLQAFRFEIPIDKYVA